VKRYDDQNDVRNGDVLVITLHVTGVES